MRAFSLPAANANIVRFADQKALVVERISLAPLYDVMTLRPLIDSRMMPHKHFKLSMSMGNRPYYRTQQLTREHVLATARRAGLSMPETESLISKIIDDAESAFEAVAGIVNDDATQAINESDQ